MPASRHRAVVGRFPTVRRTAFLLLSGLLTGLSLTVPAAAQDAPVQRASPSDPYAGHITEAARRFGIPEAWIRAVMRVESRGDLRAISPKGAMGLMQIMPATWAILRARHGLGGDPYYPRDNIMAGAAYLREMHDRYGSPGFLAAYNAGPGRYEEHRATGRPLPAETRAYVAALEPIIGGGDLAVPVTVATADPLAWTRAPLFIVQVDSRPSADRRRADGDPAAPSAPESATDPARPALRSDGLFVARTDSAGPR
ncbi:MAG: lytic transglycosylase domain-containing protein [Mesorhizobium sp.]|uniref:lytic transglycosylase domain-containing protein n=1 Tax=Mesorhizobium sp. TaxID=1871066 RepID=UPI000FE4FFCF|nr:lytic transglycosylase domain-containing protein [Mesorhizobium sp.]RWH82201.1 MAG: lytic transglycosylase domain-containing protein [Mesorhizobium sp.]RWH85202.1 MAG: lytic transglycosylase domain-containing protein [Mesorhizobium sp.]RWH89957.1 MAG: lytic transglycosylase domain-containing protein [Mesorhizobium sp.]RWH98293.1 MAG: lytic transglycosylase domain-containing protein [Mesorhizobium sp.]RWI04699.1 MAG: lytic transglycosylase domain-containing protein [Mesorhizobium sp.]